ncbi:MAG: DUF86 domain-containing protein [bacterium]|nr:DUF86 domain-containing protein [bacterium]
MIREIVDFIQDILDATNDIEKFIKGLDFESFSRDRKTVYAVIRAIEIMGEATKNIPDAVRSNYPEVPWKQITGMRDKLIHGYFGIDMMTLWKAATQDAPKLKALITKIREDVED